jgi:DNA-binding transcriptional regulator YiaG
MNSSLRARLGNRAQIRDISPRASGSSAAYVLKASAEFAKTVAAARLFIRGGITPSRAKSLVERLLVGDSIAVIVPAVESAAAFDKSLAALGLKTERRAIPRHIDVAEIRRRLALTQEEFAARFGLNVATVRNWEQGRSEPDEPARGYLAVIATHPEIAEAAVSA